MIYLEFLTLSKGQIQLFLSRAWIDEIAALGSSSGHREEILLLLYNFIPIKKSSDNQSSLHPTSLVLLSSELLSS